MDTLVLIPHIEVQRRVEDYREGLFREGFLGAHSLPVCAPIALLSRPFSGEELKALAENIREQSLGSEGKIIGGDTVKGELGEVEGTHLKLLGPALNLNFDDRALPAPGKILSIINRPCICASVIREEPNLDSLKPLRLSFRAAFVANLKLRALDETGYSFSWTIGKGAWLRKYS
ncbi:MAG: hypothetical protein FWG77_07520 [Treponema sp.]|nr:hypothetical protein [Treponema sp.]